MLVPISYNVRSLMLRKARTGLTILGIASVVSVFVVMTSVSAHMKQLFKTTGQPDEVIVTQAGAIIPEFSQASRASATWLATQPQVAGVGGQPVVSPELGMSSVVTLPGGRQTRDGLIRGLEPGAVAYYREVSLTSGAPLGAADATRVIVGAQFARAHKLQLGDVLTFERAKWTVGGTFSAGGSVYEQEIWVDLDALSAATNRVSVTSFMVRALSDTHATALVDAIGAQRSEPLMAMTAPAAWARMGGMSVWMATLGRFIAIIIALGAIFGGMNTMYSAVAQRSREIAILRAVGYRRASVLLSMLFESVVVGLLGGVLGAVMAFGVALVPLKMPFLLEGGVLLRTPDLVAGLVLGLLVGALGGILPAAQAGALKAVDALR